MLFGRAVLIPVLGPEGFAAWAGLARTLHNYLGPFFGAGLVIMILIWLKDNLPKKIDFNISSSVQETIDDAHLRMGDHLLELRTRVLDFREYGKRAPFPNRIQCWRNV